MHSRKRILGDARRRFLTPSAYALAQYLSAAARCVPTLALAFCLSALAQCRPAFAQESGHEHAAPAKAKPAAALTTGYGNWHHPVSTKNAQAQAFFDQGLRQ